MLIEEGDNAGVALRGLFIIRCGSVGLQGGRWLACDAAEASGSTGAPSWRPLLPSLHAQARAALPPSPTSQPQRPPAAEDCQRPACGTQR